MTTIETRRRACSTLSRYPGRGQGEGPGQARRSAFAAKPSPLPLPAYRERGKVDGLLQILKFNWTSYAVGGLVLIAAVVLLPHLRLPPFVRAFVCLGVALP